jgi:hypothetical protein
MDMGRDKEPYKKLAYWIKESQVGDLEKIAAERAVKLRMAKGVMCTPLDPINKISLVAPSVWDETCRRPGSWYHVSDKSGLYLVISSFELAEFEKDLSSIITESNFVPEALATKEDKLALVADPAYTALAPRQWSDVEETEKRIYLRWAKRLGSDLDDYELLFLTQSANHANFITPRLFTRGENGLVPYSVDRSAHLCSCCLELFQVIGERHPQKLVAPCPGATIFARLRRDRYLLASRPLNRKIYQSMSIRKGKYNALQTFL